MLGSAVFIPITAMGQDFLLDFGWRIPFLLAGPLALVTLYIRAQVKETEAFKAVVIEERGNEPAAAIETAPKPAAVPLWEIVRDHWRNLLRVIVCSLFALTGTMANVFAINYGTEQQGLDPSILLAITSVIGIVTLPLAPLLARLSDGIGRRPVFIGSVLLIAVGFFGVFGAMSTGNYMLIAVSMFLLMVVAAGGNIVQAPLYTEMFPTRVRYTGYAVGTQVGLIVVGFSPTIAAALVLPGVNGWVPVAIFIAVCMVAAAISAFTAKETRGMSIEEIDGTTMAKADAIR
jgi:MFS family permease